MEQKKLYKSRSNKFLCGVCGGLGEYLNVDANIIRLVCVLLGATGTGILVYIVAALILPEGE